MKRKYASVLVLFLSLLLTLSGTLSSYAEGLVNSPVYLKASACDASVIALKSDGTVWTWGRNDVGQIGDGTEGIMDFRSTPTLVKGISDAIDVASGGSFNVVLKKDGSVWAWGDVDFGSFDDLGYDKVHLVRQIPELSGIIEIAAGDSHSMALKNDGTLWVWGMNKSGQLGNGGADMFYPVQVIR